ncbi:MAG: dipeptidase [Gemmatimonadota bacterium]
MSEIATYLEQNGARFEEELEEFLRIPSVSTESRYAADVRRCAEWLRDHLEAAGVEQVEIVPTSEGHPIVLGEHRAGPDAPTVLLYGHYDVQPTDPEDLWTSPPFEPDVRDGRLYARGAVDDKGQVHMHIKALETLSRAGGGIPVNVKLVIEGEEEVGSTNLGSFLREHRERLACDVVVISDTGMFAADVPCITMGLRGIVYEQVTVRGPNRDLHSGTYGGAVVNPANALASLIAGLKDENERVTVPGFYDRVRPMKEAEREEVASLPFREEELRADVGAPELRGETGYSALERVWFRPTLDVNGLLSGFTGEGAKTVLPATAMAKISMRLVPDQDPEEIAAAFEAHVARLAPPGVAVSVERFHGGQPWAAEASHPVFEAAAAALEKGFGRRPIFIREGGSIPIVPMFEDTFGAPSLLIGFGLPGSNPHSPNEWLDLGVYHRGIDSLADLYGQLGSLTI